MVCVAWVNRQAVLPRFCFEVTHVCINSSSAVVATPGLSNPWAASLPAIKQIAYGLATTLRRCSPHLGAGSALLAVPGLCLF